jgi:hypothetical protein
MERLQLLTHSGRSNPVKDELIIDLNREITDVVIEITDVHGDLILRNQCTNVRHNMVNIEL